MKTAEVMGIYTFIGRHDDTGIEIWFRQSGRVRWDDPRTRYVKVTAGVPWQSPCVCDCWLNGSGQCFL